MEALKFNPSDHLSEIQTWSNDRGMGQIPEHLLPKTGRIVPGVCAVFLYLTDSSVGFLENLISNPKDVSKEDTTKAIDLCIYAIEKDAKEKGVSLLLSTTCLPSIMKRAERLGFHVQTRVFKLILKGI